MRRIAAALGIMICIGPARGLAQDAYLPETLLRALHQVQENLAFGDPTAAAAQTEIFARLKNELTKPVSEIDALTIWERTAIGFALSGGDAAASKAILSRIDGKSRYFELGQAVKLYISGEVDEAARRLATIDPPVLAGGLTPYTMMALGTATLDTDADTARRSFEAVALEAPGTLLEEVALRRLLALSMRSDDNSTFDRVSNLYLRRYLSSPFAAQFIDTYATGASRFLSPDEVAKALKVIAQQPSANRRALTAALLTTCAVNGQLDMLRQILNEGTVGITDEGEPLAAKLKLYGFISSVRSLAGPESLRLAETNDYALLDDGDRLMKKKTVQAFERVFDELRGVDLEAGRDHDAKALQNAQSTAPSSPSNNEITRAIAQLTVGDGGDIDASAIAKPAFDHWFETRVGGNFDELDEIEQYVGAVGG